MAKGKGGGTVGTVEALVMPVLEQLGMRLWDVRFEKEGPDWFLRIYIDRDEPLDLNACEEATRAINPVIDAADPIDQSYFMEVGSPGLGRKLTRDVHFEAMRGRRVAAHLIRATAAGHTGRQRSGIRRQRQQRRRRLRVLRARSQSGRARHAAAGRRLRDGYRGKRSELLQIVRR